MLNGLIFFRTFKINLDVRQGSVLSPVLFCNFFFSVIANCSQRGLYSLVILYYDDILLLSSIRYVGCRIYFATLIWQSILRNLVVRELAHDSAG